MSDKLTDLDIEALSLNHGTVNGVRNCENPPPGWGRCRRCEAEKKLAQLGFVRKQPSRLSTLLRELADLV